MLGKASKISHGKKPGLFILSTSKEDRRSGIFNLIWVYNEVRGWLLELRLWL